MLKSSGLEPLTPLGHVQPETVTIGGITITERTDTALASLATRRGREADVAKTAKAAGIPLPGPATWARDQLSAFWLAPEMWMVEAPFATHEDIRSHLKPLFGEAASITEQTDAWVRFDIAGESLIALMERLSNVDLARAPLGHATRTVVEHLGCYLIKHGQAEITLYGPRSSAQFLHHALETAAKSL